MVKYNERLGRYQDDTGKMIPLSEAENRLIDQEVSRTAVRLQGHARLLSYGRITIGEFQARVAETLKLGHLRMSSLGAGGNKGLTKRHFGKVGAQLKAQYRYLHWFGNDLAAGKLTDLKKLLSRTASYAASLKTAFHESKKITKSSEGFDEAKRDLDPQSNHCSSCLGYCTNGLFRPISEVVAPGVRCLCHSHCRCRISYRRSKKVANG